MVLLATGLLAIVVAVTGAAIVASLRASRRDAQIQTLLSTFGPLAERVRADPRLLLAWSPVAETARGLFPEAFRDIEAAAGDRFPFGRGLVESAHARWTADWLEWERTNDVEYRERSAALEAELDQSPEAVAKAARARLETLERERLERYQRRYEEYVGVSRALAEHGEDRPDELPANGRL
jgi:hypothetical protein